MKKTRVKRVAELGPDDIRPEYDFSKGRQNPYASRFVTGTVAVVLDPDVAERFPDSRAVNDALRGLTANPPRGRRPSKRRTA